VLRGRLLGARGKSANAHEAFRHARTQLENLPLPYERPRVDFAQGITLRRAGHRRDATTVLSTARQAFAALGTQVYVELCDRELKAAQPGVRRHESDIDMLTDRSAVWPRTSPGAWPTRRRPRR
jgi:hypothetical protein